MGLIQRTITVTRADGTTYQRKQWVRDNLGSSPVLDRSSMSAQPKSKIRVPGSDLTESQERFLSKSQVRDEFGNPLPVYHGTTANFDHFDESTVGKGNDSWGNGFYFTSKKSHAEGFGTAKEFYLDVRNPIRLDGKKETNMNDIEFSVSDAKKILRQHPDLYIQPDDEDRTNFLRDYSAHYWDAESHSRADLERMSDNVIDAMGEGTITWTHMEVLFGDEHGAAYLRAVEETTGHDGVIVDFDKEHGQIVVAWRPNQIKLSSNLDPDPDSDRIDA